MKCSIYYKNGLETNSTFRYSIPHCGWQLKLFLFLWRLICSLVTVFLFDVALATFSVTVKKYRTKATCG